jgi:hypothetical protein
VNVRSLPAPGTHDSPLVWHARAPLLGKKTTAPHRRWSSPRRRCSSPRGFAPPDPRFHAAAGRGAVVGGAAAGTAAIVGRAVASRVFVALTSPVARLKSLEEVRITDFG